MYSLTFLELPMLCFHMPLTFLWYDSIAAFLQLLMSHWHYGYTTICVTTPLTFLLTRLHLATTTTVLFTYWPTRTATDCLTTLRTTTIGVCDGLCSGFPLQINVCIIDEIIHGIINTSKAFL